MIKELKEKELQIKKLVGGGFMATKVHNELFEIPPEERDQDEIKDGYQLKFVGKDYAKLQAGLKTETIITPDTAHNSKPENANSENIFITGDNLDTLKHLENAYSGKVDVIYIDPPYNTGSDGFVYADNFNFSDDDLKEKLNLTEEEISRVRALSGKSSHSAWLTFMLPRLMIAKRLLSDTGVIFISIDDNEQAQLKMLCDEIFNENNFISSFCWHNNKKGRQMDKGVKNTFETILMYGKDKNLSTTNPEAREVRPSKNTIFLEDSISKYRKGYPLHNGTADFHINNRPNLAYSIYIKDGVEPIILDEKSGELGNYEIKLSEEGSKLIDSGFLRITPKKNTKYGTQRVWRWGVNKFRNEYASELMLIQEDTGPYFYQKERILNNNTKLQTFTNYIDIDTSKGKAEINSLFNNKTLFSFAKNSQLIKTLLRVSSKDSLILDFFAGSGTTADAVMQLNKEDGGNRKYILVQLPEKVSKNSEAEKAGYKTIDQISRERIERAAAKISDNSGFKHFRLTTPNDENTLSKLEEFNPNANVAFPEDMTTTFDGGEKAILQTWLIDDGFEFNQTPKIVEFAGYQAHYIEQRLYLISTGWSSEATRDLLNAIGKNKLAVQSIVIFPYSFAFNELNELKINLRTAFEKSNKIELLERY